ncbi:MAG TPA: insulinase family protein, partial [Thermoanaerobaculia bacterium]
MTTLDRLARAILYSLPAVLFALPLAAAEPTAKKLSDLHYPPLPPLQVAQPERVVLDNGLVVMLL